MEFLYLVLQETPQGNRLQTGSIMLALLGTGLWTIILPTGTIARYFCTTETISVLVSQL